jgi:hypothetical protein
MESTPVRPRRFDWIGDLDHVALNMAWLRRAILKSRIHTTEDFEPLIQALLDLQQSPFAPGQARKVRAVLELAHERSARSGQILSDD